MEDAVAFEAFFFSFSYYIYLLSLLSLLEMAGGEIHRLIQLIDWSGAVGLFTVACRYAIWAFELFISLGLSRFSCLVYDLYSAHLSAIVGPIHFCWRGWIHVGFRHALKRLFSVNVGAIPIPIVDSNRLISIIPGCEGARKTIILSFSIYIIVDGYLIRLLSQLTQLLMLEWLIHWRFTWFISLSEQEEGTWRRIFKFDAIKTPDHSRHVKSNSSWLIVS